MELHPIRPSHSGSALGDGAALTTAWTRVLAVLGLVLCGYLTFPAWTSVHVEGFSAQIQSIAFLKGVAPSVQPDPYMPRLTQFIEETRSGVIDMLSLAYRHFPNAGDSAFRGVMLASFALLLVASVATARRWGGTRVLVALFALVLTPGIPETAFYFNDNLVSAAFATLALALITSRPSSLMALLSGACCAMAILCRLDAVFMLPMILGTLLHATPQNRSRLTLSMLGVAGALAVLAASAWLHGFSVLDSFATATQFVMGKVRPLVWLQVRVYFFGLAVLPFLLIGIVLAYMRWKSQRAWLAIATFIVYPIALALFAPNVTEVRYILPLLAPVIAMHAGTGLQWTARRFSSARWFKDWLVLGIVGLTALVFLFPPAVVSIADGPRSVLGRLWSPLAWSTWQDSVRQSMSRIGQLVGKLEDGHQNIVITTHYNDDLYLRLRLMEAGFTPLPAASKFPGCNGFSIFTKGASTVIHIRTHRQYKMAPVTFPYAAALQIDATFSCPALRPSGKVFATTFGDYDWAVDPHVFSFSPTSFPGPATVTFDDALHQTKVPLSHDYGYVVVRELSPQELAATVQKARDYLRAAREDRSAAGEHLTIEDYQRAYRALPGPTSRWLAGQASAGCSAATGIGKCSP